MQFKYDDVQITFNCKQTFDSQLKVFLDTVLISHKEIELHYEPVCQDLEKIFKFIFPRCKAFRFGSTVNGLSFKNCDLDIYLYTGLPVIEDSSKNFGPHIVSLDNLFAVIQKILRKNSNIFSVVCTIRFAKMPIIKCIHNRTKISCDISFKHNLGMYNTQLVKFYLFMDPRFHPLMAIIKYWINACETRCRICISKYALTMLLIFYLQQIKLVPPIIDLQRQCTVPLFLKDWQINFSKVFKFKMDTDYKDKSIPELLQGFFQFYAYYDFQTNTVCTIDGNSYSKELFKDVEYLPETMKKYKEHVQNSENTKILSTWQPMCVQDPIELNHNITGNIQDKHLERFQIFCRIALNIVINSAQNNYQDLLHNLFITKMGRATER